MIQVKGTLTDAGGNPASHAHILFKTSKGFGSVLPSAELTVITDSQGGYDFTLSVGIHLIYVRYGDGFELIGKTVINSDTPSPLTVSDLLNQTQPILPEEIAQVATMLAEVRAIYQSAKVLEETILTSAEQVSTDAQQVMQSKKIVSDLAAQVALDSSAVAEGVSSVSQSKEQVTALAQDVSTKAQQVTDDKARVEMLSQQVEQDASQSSNAAELAKRWAVGINPPSEADTPTAENNARHWAKLAQYNANQTFKSGGYFTPELAQEYPDVTAVNVDTIWLIKFANETGSYTFTTGELTGQTVKNGFMLVYDTPLDTFDFIPTTLSGVYSINGIFADATNNLNLTAADVGALPLAGGLMYGRINLWRGANQLMGAPITSEDVNAYMSPDDASFSYAHFALDAPNIFPVRDNANGVLSFNTHSGGYNHQLGFSSNGKIYHRTRHGLNGVSLWYELYTTANKPNATDVGAVVGTTKAAFIPAGTIDDRPTRDEFPANTMALRFNKTTGEWEGLDPSGNIVPIGNYNELERRVEAIESYPSDWLEVSSEDDPNAVRWTQPQYLNCGRGETHWAWLNKNAIAINGIIRSQTILSGNAHWVFRLPDGCQSVASVDKFLPVSCNDTSAVTYAEFVKGTNEIRIFLDKGQLLNTTWFMIDWVIPVKIV
ncbi:TPA: hypothetical protein ACGF6M_001664 [Vibrio cholerae]